MPGKGEKRPLKRQPKKAGNTIAGKAFAQSFGTSASRSRVSSTSLPTITPSPCMGAFQLTPKSSRFMAALAANPVLVSPSKLVAGPDNSASPVMERVTPRMVRSPVTLALFSPSGSILVLLKVMEGCFSAWKKSSLRRWPSRFLIPVVRLAVSMATSSEERAMSAAVVVSPLPSLPLNIAAGAFFGPFAGTVYSIFGALGGAAASFMIARRLGREFMERFLGGHVNFCSRCSDRVLTRIIFVSRLIPVVSFDLVSYGAGLTAMSFWKFCLATFLGMIPLTALYNYTGAVLTFDRGLVLAAGLVMVVLFFALPRWLEKKNLLSFGEAPDCHGEDGPVKEKTGA